MAHPLTVGERCQVNLEVIILESVTSSSEMVRSEQSLQRPPSHCLSFWERLTMAILLHCRRVLSHAPIVNDDERMPGMKQCERPDY